MSRRAADTDVFHAIADPTRRRILDALVEGEAPVKQLLSLFDISQPAVSQHLKVLRDAGLVRERPVGRERIYSIVAAELQLVAEWAGQYERFWNKRLDKLGQYLDRKHQTSRAAVRSNRRRKGG